MKCKGNVFCALLSFSFRNQIATYSEPSLSKPHFIKQKKPYSSPSSSTSSPSFALPYLLRGTWARRVRLSPLRWGFGEALVEGVAKVVSWVDSILNQPSSRRRWGRVSQKLSLWQVHDFSLSSMKLSFLFPYFPYEM